MACTTYTAHGKVKASVNFIKSVLVYLVIFFNAHIQNMRVKTILLSVRKTTLLSQPLMNFNQISKFVIYFHFLLHPQWSQEVIGQSSIGECLALLCICCHLELLYVALINSIYFL